MKLPFHDSRTHYSQNLTNTNISFLIGPTKLFSFVWMQASLESYIFFPRVILYNFFLLLLIYGGWGFQLMGFGACINIKE